MKHLLIIGGGPSGIMAAIRAKEVNRDLKVTLVEQNDRIGRKLLATGNGRGNFTNVNNSALNYNYPWFVEPTLAKFSSSSLRNFFNELGVLSVVDEEGRTYPYPDSANALLDSLRIRLDQSSVNILVNSKVVKIQQNSNKCNITLSNNQILSGDGIIFAFGGQSYPTLGSDGSCYPLVKALGHTLTPLLPSIVMIKVNNQEFKALSGIRVKGRVILTSHTQIITSQEGELLFKDEALSGIATFMVSTYIARMLQKDDKTTFNLTMDLLPLMSENEVFEFLNNRKQTQKDYLIEQFLTGLFVKMLNLTLLKKASINSFNQKVSTLNNDNIKALSRVIKNYPLEYKSLGNFINAQVTVGGVDIEQVNQDTLASKVAPNLYFCGEALNIDGECGGHNLQWAFASGYVAGENAAIKLARED